MVMENQNLVNDFGAGVADLTSRHDGKALYNYTPRVELQHHIHIADAEAKLRAGLQYYLGEKYQWLPAYDKVVEWLTDNKGRGLLCQGSCGLGKTVICQYIIPVLINRYARKVPNCYTAIDMTQKFDTIQDKCGALLFIDDIGTEPVEVNIYGNRHIPFNEIVDSCERKGGLLVITTNIRTTRATDPTTGLSIPSIQERYGLRTLDRLRAITKVIVFEGKSMRG